MSVTKASANPIQPTTDSLDGGSLLSDLMGGGDGDVVDEPSDSDVIDAADSSDWNDDPADVETSDEEAQGEEGGETTDEPAAEEGETTEGEEAAAKAEDAKKADVEEIEVTDETGRRKIQIDYSDRKATRRAHEQAAGARKLYARNRELRSELDAAKPRLEAGEKAVTRWNKIEAEYQARGMDGVIEMISGRPAQEYYSQREAEAARLAAMSPAERALHDRTRDTDKQVAEAQRIREDAERIRREAAAEREAADLERVEAMVHPEFESVRMRGKLGDATREHRIDTMIWDYVQSELVRIAERGVTPTRDLVRQTFQEAASLFATAVETRASKQTAAAIEKKKTESAREAQSAVARGERQLRRSVKGEADFTHTAGAAAFLASVVGSGKRK